MPFEDEYLLVVDKPAGLVTHPAAGLREATLVHGLLARGIAGGEDPERPGVVHRLDRDTTGLLVLARDAAATPPLSDMLRARRIEREYVTLVHGRPPSRRGTIDAPIGRDPKTSARMAVDGRAARARRHPLRARRRRSRARACSRCGSRPAARTRSACTSPRSPTPSSAIAPTDAAAASSASSASSCTPRGSPSTTRSRASASSSPRALPADLQAALDEARAE